MKFVRGVRKRWLINSVCMTLAVTVVTIIAVSFTMSSYYYSAIQSSLEQKAKTVSEFFLDYVTNTYAEYYQSVCKYTESFEDRDKLELQFVGPSGQVETSTYGSTAGISPGTPDIEEAFRTGEISSWRGKNTGTGEHILAVSSPLIRADGETIGVMRYVTSLEPTENYLTFWSLGAAAVGAAVMTLICLSNLYFIHSIVDPITQVTSVANRISEGSYGIQLEKKYDDEIGELTDAINNMSMKINQSEKMKTEFISSVSHELRTPLTAITGWGETLLYDEYLTTDERRGLEIIFNEARRLTKLVEELLEFTRMEDGRFTLNVKQIDIVRELEDIVVTYKEFLRYDEIKVEYTPYGGDIPAIPGDPERLRQVFFNLMDNAIKHGGDGGKVAVSTDLDEKYMVIRIRDFGAGIPLDELEHVKMKFYKGSSKQRGSGIGLAVCEEIIKYHGGTLTIENAKDGGLLVTIRLPLV